MNQKKSFDFNEKTIRQLAELLSETNLNEIEYETNGQRIRVVRHAKETIYAAAPVSSPAVALPIPLSESQISPSPAPLTQDFSQHPGLVKAPMVGNIYMASEPNAAPFIKEGDSVTEGQTIFIIEAMKVMNPIRAPKSGKILKIFVKDSSPVEFGESLVIIE